jgi:OOP family OmpA-OmpF porin
MKCIPPAVLVCASLWPALASTQDGGATVEKVAVNAVARFDFDRADLGAADRAALLAEVAQMKGVTWQAVTAVGHTDSVGSDDYNRALAKRRADSVRRYLLGQGLDPSMVQAEGQGEAVPVADNATEEGRAQNRRTEVRFEGVRMASR